MKLIFFLLFFGGYFNVFSQKKQNHFDFDWVNFKIIPSFQKCVNIESKAGIKHKIQFNTQNNIELELSFLHVSIYKIYGISRICHKIPLKPIRVQDEYLFPWGKDTVFYFAENKKGSIENIVLIVLKSDTEILLYYLDVNASSIEDAIEKIEKCNKNKLISPEKYSFKQDQNTRKVKKTAFFLQETDKYSETSVWLRCVKRSLFLTVLFNFPAFC